MNLSKSTLIEIVGWYGVSAILAAYVLSTMEVVQANSFWHQVLNLTGSMGIVAVALKKKDYQPLVLNVIWCLVAGLSLISLIG